MATLSLLDWVICFGYLVIVFAMGLWFARGQHTNEDYFVGGRKMHWLPIGLSVFAGTFSSLSFVGLPREAAYDDYHLLLAILFIPFVVMPIVGWLFIPLFFRLGLISAYEYLDRRFSRPVRLLASALYTFYTIGWMGNLLLAVGVILQTVLQLTESQMAWMLVAIGLFATFYTAIGGVKAVVWTDAMQAFALGGGMLIVLICGVGQLDGGWNALWQVGSQHDKFAMFHMEYDITHILDSERINVFSACAFGFFVYLAGHAVAFTAVQRYVSMPDIKSARRALVVNGAMVAVVCLLFFMVGTMVFVYYQQALPPDAVAGSGFPELARQDQLVPHFVMTVIPYPGLVGLLLAGLFAAAMSSIDSGINSLTATVVCDVLAGKQMPLRLSRILCILFGIAAIATSLVLQRWGGNVFDIIMTIAGTFLGLLLGIFLLGMFSTRANTAGAVIGLLGGSLTLFAASKFNVSHWWYGAFSSIPTIVIGYLASYSFAAPPENKLQGLTFSWTGSPRGVSKETTT